MNIIDNLSEMRRELKEAREARLKAKRHAKPQKQMLTALHSVRPGVQGHSAIYAGTVPYAEIQRRRRRNKAAKASRKINRGR